MVGIPVFEIKFVVCMSKCGWGCMGGCGYAYGVMHALHLSMYVSGVRSALRMGFFSSSPLLPELPSCR